jgi:hypothetical protein
MQANLLRNIDAKILNKIKANQPNPKTYQKNQAP